jgi:ATP-dependent Clp protease ATP-binding subunit ClpC
VDVEPDPDKPGKQRFVFTSVEGFIPPAAVELAITATGPTPAATTDDEPEAPVVEPG